MTPERWRRLDDLFVHAAELPAAERTGFAADACDDDAELHAELTSLLASAADTANGDAAGGDASIARTIGSAAAALTMARIGPYRVLGLIGEGGMGTVYLAERADAAYRRKVAIKVLRGDLASPLAAARFRDERQVLAALDHPGIVRLLDGGRTDDDVPYLVMEHIDGRPFAAHARALPVRERVALVIRIALALQYAHQHLIVHRDVKPSNLLVDRDGAPRLLDFGIAKLLDPDAHREAETRTGTAAFTIEYCSPEQVRGEPVSVATDVYSLGAVLYDVLVGQPPQHAGATTMETLASICDRDPPRPSVAAPALRRELAGDLDNILLRALAKRPERRYASIAAFADDLRRYLAGLPVTARDATLRYRLGKLIRRRYRALAAAALIVGALATATIVSIAQARRADRQAARANADRLALLVDNGRQALLADHPGRALPLLAEALRAGADTAAVRFLLGAAMRPYQARVATIPADDGFTDVAWLPDGSRFALTSMQGHGGLYDRDGHRLAPLEGDGTRDNFPIFNRDGTLVAAADGAYHVLVWDATTGVRRATIAGGWVGSRTHAFLERSGRLVTADRRLALWDLTTGALIASTDVGCDATSLAVAPDEATLAVGCEDATLLLFDANPLGPGVRLGDTSRGAYRLEFSPDGRRLYSSAVADIAIWDVPRRSRIATLPGRLAVLSPDGTRLVAVDEDSVGRIFDATTGLLRLELIGHDAGGLNAIAWSRDGTKIATAGSDGTFRTWNALTGERYTVIEAAVGAGRGTNAFSGAITAALSPDGSRMATVAGTGASLWRVDRAPLITELATRGRLWSATWSPDERTIATAGPERGGLWPDGAPPIEVPLSPGHQAPRQPDGFNPFLQAGSRIMYDVNWSPDGARMVMAGDPDLARVYERDGTLAFALIGHTRRVNRAAFSPDGRLIATAGSDGDARLWDAATGAPVAVLPHGGAVMAAAWSRDGARLATACFDHHLRVWDVATRTVAIDLDGGATKYLDVTISPDGRELVAAGQAGQAEIWDLATRRRRLGLIGHASITTNAVWSPDGGLIATASSDHSARVWDPATGALLATFPHPSDVMSLQWSRDGERLLTGSNEGNVRVWDVHRAAGPPLLIDAFIATHLR